MEMWFPFPFIRKANRFRQVTLLIFARCTQNAFKCSPLILRLICPEIHKDEHLTSITLGRRNACISLGVMLDPFQTCSYTKVMSVTNFRDSSFQVLPVSLMVVILVKEIAPLGFETVFFSDFCADQ